MDENTRTAELRRKLDKDPGSRLFAQLAEELRKEGRHEEAIQVAWKGLEKHPNYPSARLTLARAFLDSGRPAEAKPELEQVVKASPDNIMASRLLGDALEDLGSLDAALKQFEQTLRIAPGDKALVEKIAELKGRLAPPPTIEIKPTPKPAPPPVVEPPAPTPAVEAPPPAPPAPVAAVALDRDLASGTFSPGSLNASDLQKHFDESHGAPSAAATQAPEPEIERTVAFEHFEGSPAAVSQDAAPAAPAVDLDRTVAFGELEHFGIREDAAPSRAIAGPPPELEHDPDRTVAFAEPDAPAPVVEEPEVMSLSASSVGLEPLPEPTFSTSAPEIAATSEVIAETSAEVASTAELTDDDIGGQTLPVTSVTLADLYLQQGLKKEASAVLSQVLKEEPDNEAAKSKLEASVQGESVAPTPEEGFSQTAPLTPPWLKPGADPLQVPAHPSAPVVEELPDLTTAVPEPSVAAPVSVPSTPPRAAGVGAKKKARERMLAGLQALLDATQREAEHQRATEAQTFQGANQEHRT